MSTKKKLSVTIDEELLGAVNKASKESNMGKSKLAQEALKLWLKKRTEDLMAKGYVEMAQEDRELSELTFDSQKETLR